jgi:hypothetical protein
MFETPDGSGFTDVAPQGDTGKLGPNNTVQYPNGKTVRYFPSSGTTKTVNPGGSDKPADNRASGSRGAGSGSKPPKRSSDHSSGASGGKDGTRSQASGGSGPKDSATAGNPGKDSAAKVDTDKLQAETSTGAAGGRTEFVKAWVARKQGQTYNADKHKKPCGPKGSRRGSPVTLPGANQAGCGPELDQAPDAEPRRVDTSRLGQRVRAGVGREAVGDPDPFRRGQARWVRSQNPFDRSTVVNPGKGD